VAGAKLSRRLLWIENLGWSPRDRRAPIARQGLIEVLDKSLEEEHTPRVDERLARVVRIIVSNMTGM
jgi:hypothetical protein